METREKQPRDNSAGLGQDSGSSSRNIHNNVFEPFCRTESPNKWTKYWMKQSFFPEEGGLPEPVLGPLNTFE